MTNPPPNPLPAPGSDAAELPPFNDFACCPKCGSLSVGVQYHAERSFGEIHACRGEHLDRYCNRCHYEWQEACIDPLDNLTMRPRTDAAEEGGPHVD